MKKINHSILFFSSILLALVGFLPSLLTLVGVDRKSKLNPNYYNSKNESLFVKKETEKD